MMQALLAIFLMCGGDAANLPIFTPQDIAWLKRLGISFFVTR